MYCNSEPCILASVARMRSDTQVRLFMLLLQLLPIALLPFVICLSTGCLVCPFTCGLPTVRLRCTPAKGIANSASFVQTDSQTTIHTDDWSAVYQVDSVTGLVRPLLGISWQSQSPTSGVLSVLPHQRHSSADSHAIPVMQTVSSADVQSQDPVRNLLIMSTNSGQFVSFGVDTTGLLAAPQTLNYMCSQWLWSFSYVGGIPSVRVFSFDGTARPFTNINVPSSCQFTIADATDECTTMIIGCIGTVLWTTLTLNTGTYAISASGRQMAMYPVRAFYRYGYYQSVVDNDVHLLDLSAMTETTYSLNTGSLWCSLGVKGLLTFDRDRRVAALVTMEGNSHPFASILDSGMYADNTTCSAYGQWFRGPDNDGTMTFCTIA